MWTVQEVVLSTPANVHFFSSTGEGITWAQVMAARDALFRWGGGQTWADDNEEVEMHDWLTKTVALRRRPREPHDPLDPRTMGFSAICASNIPRSWEAVQRIQGQGLCPLWYFP